MNITWTITHCDRITANDFITVAHWTASAVDTSLDGDFTASVYATCSFAEGVATTPYADVTEAQVLGWCWANGVDKDATETALAANINLQKNPVVAAGTPWSV